MFNKNLLYNLHFGMIQTVRGLQGGNKCNRLIRNNDEYNKACNTFIVIPFP